MKTVDVGYLKDVSILQRSFDDYVVTDVSFGDKSIPNGLHDFDNERCYLVKKAELDAYMTRKEDLELMNCTPIWDAYNRLKVKVNELECENADLRDKVKAIETEKNTWKEKCGSVITDTFRVLSSNPFGVKFDFDGWSEDGNWLITMDFPELDEAKKKISDLEQRLRLAESRETYWRDRKEEEEDYHHYWLHTYNLTVGLAATKGVHIFMNGEDKENNVGDIWVKNEKAEELEVKIGELEKDRDYWKDRFTKLKADIDTLKNKGRDLEKELKDLKSKTVAEVRYEWKSDGFTLIYTMRDGSKQTTSVGLADDIDEKCTMGAFVCRSFNIPQCKNCKNHRYFTNSGHYCHLPDSKYTIPGMFHIHSLTEEDAEGPACDKFEARKE